MKNKILVSISLALNIFFVGIAGDTVENISKMINYVNSVNPKKIFVMMGINDLQGNKNQMPKYIFKVFFMEIKINIHYILEKMLKT